ncbi:MAG: hypothetical protein KC466_06230 [Myxococcales bacterium]|nr:hypothetical protein [Myxococcales bacterium]
MVRRLVAVLALVLPGLQTGCASRVPFASQIHPRGVATASVTESSARDIVTRAVAAHGAPHRWSSLILARSAAAVDAAPAEPDAEYFLSVPERWLGADVVLRSVGARRFEGKSHEALLITGRTPGDGGGRYLALFDEGSGRLAHLFVADALGGAFHAAYQGWREVAGRWLPGRVVLEDGRILDPAVHAAAR